MKCIIVDIDGTLANIDHRKHLLPTLRENGDYEPSGRSWDAFHAAAVDDAPYPEIVTLVNAMSCAGYQIILCTGRGEETREHTNCWLLSQGVFFDRLVMRPYKDHRKDDVLKSEMLDGLLAEGLEPLFVIEDRARVVAMWRARGLRCLQVCEGDY
jgi:hypothetical protein